MAPMQVTTAFKGTGLSLLTPSLIRRDHLYPVHGLFWVLVAAAVLGTWLGLANSLAVWTSFSYPPALSQPCVVQPVKALHAEMNNTRTERDVRPLSQRLALFEADLQTLRQTSKADFAAL